MFFKLWVIVLLINQLLFYDVCFSGTCILLALPHTGMISIFLYYSYYGLKVWLKHFNPIEDKESIYDKVLESYDGILLALLAKVSKSDGHISAEEAKYMSNLYTELCKERKSILAIREIYKEIEKNEKENLNNINELCLKLNYDSISQFQKVYLIEALVAFIYIDSKDIEVSESLILKIVYSLDFDVILYQKILERYKQDTSSQSENKNYSKIDEYYKVLKSKKEDSDSEIKKSYRALVRQYHTDILVSKELPEDMILFAEEKIKLINRAYEVIKEERAK
jgi:DnaJ like chaperone protein